MTKKDYELFAKKLNDKKPENWETKINFGEVVELIAEVLANDNPRFNYEKFKDACYFGKHIRKSIKA